MIPSELNKMGERITRLALNLQKIRERREREEYNKCVQEEIVKPFKRFAKKTGLKVIVIRSKSKAHK